MAKRRAGPLALYVGAPRPYYSLMTQDNAYAFSTFAAIGGTDYEGETFSSMRIFASYEAALDYAWELIDDGVIGCLNHEVELIQHFTHVLSGLERCMTTHIRGKVNERVEVESSRVSV